jgi:subtilase family serine protease
MILKKSYILIIFLLVLLIPLAGADYSYEGIAFTPDAQGTIRGELYIDGGHGLGFTPYSQTFNVPDGTVRFGRLYVGIWGGTEYYEGWVQPSFNGQTLEKLQLSGINDKSENVYCAGHGVYWVCFDVSSLTESGENTVEILTSSGEAGSKIDGRIYGTVLVAACDNPNAPLISYQLFSGNENLHGKGWSKGSGDTKDRAEIDFDLSQNLENIQDAELSVVYLTGSKGLPDYLEFNKIMLGTSPSYLSDMGFQEQATDIANEDSYDASGDEGISSNYFDVENFNVLEYLQTGNNSLCFVRGIDLNQDGNIGDSEGEDYLHPVLASLVLTSRSTASVLPDLYPEIEVDEEEIIEGMPAEISFMINNPGDIYDENCTVSFQVDGTEYSTSNIKMLPSGVCRSTFTWPATSGEHRIRLIVDSEDNIKESDEENNAYELTIRAKSKPELTVSIGDPVKIEENIEPVEASLFVLAVFSLLGFLRKKPKTIIMLLIIVLVVGFFSGCVEQNPDTENSACLIPVTITNNGEASAQDFNVNLYLDGECVADVKISELSGDKSITEELRVTVSSGEHTLCVKVDEDNHIIESDEDNNEYEISYYFD